MPFTLDAKGPILGQTDEHTISLFHELGRIAPGPLENVVERCAQVFVVLSGLVIQEFISDSTRTPSHTVGPSFHGESGSIGISAALFPDINVSGSNRFSLVWI